MKKILSTIGAILILMPMTAGAFNDVSVNHAYYEAIDFLQQNGVIQGYDDGSFKPENLISRAEFTKMVIGAIYSEDELGKCKADKKFKDVGNSHWVNKYICMGAKKGMINGYEDGSFQPDQEVTYAEALKIAEIAFNANVVEADGEWWEKYLGFAGEKKLSFAGKRSPSQWVNRGEVAEIIYWLQSISNGKSACNVDADCGSSEMCVNNWCQSVAGCMIDTDCPTGYTCKIGMCKQGGTCYANSDCSSGYNCVDGLCKSAYADTECVVDADCIMSQWCNNGKCEKPGMCYMNSDCPRAMKCQSLSCSRKTSCNSHIDCPTGYECDSFYHKCKKIEACTSDASCPTSFYCENERCLIPASFYR